MPEGENKVELLAMPLKIGVTGGIGAGKSLVCKIFAALGAPVYDADSRAKQVMIQDQVLVGQVKGHFGEESYLADGSLNRSFLANDVFAHPEKLNLLNTLVHPRVAVDFDKWLSTQKGIPYIIKEAALLFESNSYKNLQAVIAVAAPVELRVRRTLIRDEHRSRKQIEDIMSRQLGEEERLKKADYHIHNDEKKLLIPQVLRLHKIFQAGKLK